MDVGIAWCIENKEAELIGRDKRRWVPFTHLDRSACWWYAGLGAGSYKPESSYPAKHALRRDDSSRRNDAVPHLDQPMRRKTYYVPGSTRFSAAFGTLTE